MNRFLLSLALLLTLSGTALAQALSPEAKERTLAALQQAIERRAFVPGIDFGKVSTGLKARQAALDGAGDMRSFSTAVNGVLRELGISHIRLLTPAAALQRVGRRIDLGMASVQTPEGVVVRTLAPGGPAQKAGLSEGDVILEVEGKKVQSPDEADQNGRETSLLTVRRKSDGREKLYMLVRTPYSVAAPGPTLTWPAPNVARLRLPSFTRGYSQPEIERLLGEVAAKKASGLILDLRNNGGGLVNNSTHLLSLLAPAGTPAGCSVTREIAAEYEKTTGKSASDVAEVAKWKGPTRKTTARKLAPFTGKIAILINRRSASASEIVSAVLREERGATLIGQPTAGAVLTSIFARLTDGFEVQLPLSDYVSPRGMRLEKNPLQPDIAVEGAPAPTGDEASDPAVLAALKKLTL
jgi:carboxyl-terminal processing protease